MDSTSARASERLVLLSTHGVADLYRRAELSRSANERYLTDLAVASDETVLAWPKKP